MKWTARAGHALAFGLSASVAGCGGGAPPARGPGAPGDPGAWNCLEATGHPAAGSAFVVALDGPVDPSHAPVPANPAEAIVFRLLYGTLTEVDCTGRVRPSLATDWQASEDGLVWTFTLRRGVRLARADREDEQVLDAGLVRAAWRDSRRRLLDAGAAPWPWERILLRDVRAAGDRLEVATRSPEPDLPALLSRPEFAVAVRDPGDDVLDWPRGTQGVISDPEPGTPAREMVWWPESKDRDAAVARITFRVRPGADARDLADADLLLVRDRGALAYFGAREDLRPVATLRGARLHLLTRRPSVADAVTADVRRDLAARATEALAEEIGEATADGAEEGAIVPATGSAPGDRPAEPSPELRFLFDADDAVAGDVARRLTATFPRGAARTEGLPPAAFAAALRHGRGDAFVARIAAAPSRGLASVQLATIAPWIAGGRAVPLLDPVAVLVARPGLTGIAAGRDGVPRLENAGWVRGRRP